MSWRTPQERSALDPHLARLQKIQKQLNSLCCQHDSLMPLLELSTFESTISKWETNLKNVNKKLLEFQGKVNYLAGRDQRRLEEIKSQNSKKSQVQQKDRILGKVRECVREVRDIFGSDVFRGENQVQGSNGQIIQSLYQSGDTTPQSQLQSHYQNCLQQVQSYSQLCLALLKNQLLISHCSTSSPTSSPSSPPSSLSQSQQQSLHRSITHLLHPIKCKIQYLRSTVQIPDLHDFHEKTVERLSADILEIRDGIQFLIGNAVQFYRKQDKQNLDMRIRMVQWQIKGLKKKYFRQIENMYLGQEGYEQVQEFQKNVAKDIRLLEDAYKRVLLDFQASASSFK